MEKIFKKSLALMVSAALCLTAFVGCLSVNANGTATVEVGTVENVSADATEVTVPVTVKGSDIAAAIFEIKVDNAKLSFDGILCREALTFGENIYVSTISDGDYIKPVTGTTDTYRFLVEAGTGTNVATVTDPTFNLKFKVVSLAAGETVAITAGTLTAQACNAGTFDAASGAYTGNEEAFDVSFTAGAVKVAEAAATEPVLDENITATLGSGLADTVYMSFKISKASLEKYSDFYLKVDRQTKDDSWNLVDAEPFYINKSDLGGDYLLETKNDYWFYYRGAELYSLSVPISATLYCKNDDGKVVAKSNAFTSSLSSLLKDLHASAVDKNNAKLATAITDILVTGDKAVAYFTRNAKDSGYAKLESPIANFDISDATPDLGALNAINVAYNGTTGETLTFNAGVSASPYVSAILSNISADTKDNYKVVFSCENEVTGKTFTSTTLGADMLANKTGTNFYSYLRTLPIYASNADITVTVYKDGTELGTAHYSLDQFISSKKDDANLGPVVTALGKMSQSFRAYKIK